MLSHIVIASQNVVPERDDAQDTLNPSTPRSSDDGGIPTNLVHSAGDDGASSVTHRGESQNHGQGDGGIVVHGANNREAVSRHTHVTRSDDVVLLSATAAPPPVTVTSETVVAPLPSRRDSSRVGEVPSGAEQTTTPPQKPPWDDMGTAQTVELSAADVEEEFVGVKRQKEEEEETVTGDKFSEAFNLKHLIYFENSSQNNG